MDGEGGRLRERERDGGHTSLSSPLSGSGSGLPARSALTRSFALLCALLPLSLSPPPLCPFPPLCPSPLCSPLCPPLPCSPVPLIVNLSFIPWGSVECVATVSFYTKLALVFCVPPVVLFLILGVPWAVLRVRNRYDHTDDRAVRDERKVTARKFVKLAVFALSLLYPAVSQTVLSFFNASA
jgi:hypothetical protein